jgi:hypothetical protein
MIDSDFVLWLKNPSSIRIVLVEVGVLSGGSEITRYMATGGYITGPSDTPPNQQYNPIVNTGITFVEQLSLTSAASLSGGDIEISNIKGERDSYLLDVWDGRPLQAFIGDPRWVRSDFRMIFNGIVAGLSSKDRGTLNLGMRDKLQRLNTPLIDTKLGGTTPNKDAVLPVSFGEVHNISALLSNPPLLEYTVHDGAVESIFEVRDNGVPVSITATNSTGKFTLNQASAGTITASAQGDKLSGVYSNTISALIQRIVTGYGKVSDRFVTGDLDTVNLGAFEASHTQPVGLFLNARTNVLSACQQLAVSVGAQIVMSRLGKLRLIQITLPGVGTPTVIKASQMVEKSLKIVSRPAVVASVMLGFNQNYTVQTNMLTALPEADKSLFALDWLTSTQTDSTVKTTYHLGADPVMVPTTLLRRSDADTEATRQLNLWKVQRTVYQFEATADMLFYLELGNPVTIFNQRFGMAAGVSGVVLSLAPQWLTGRVIVQVLV